MSDETTAELNRTTRGLGHPNIILERDFGGLMLGATPAWVARVETHVFVEDGMVDVVEKGFRRGDPKDTRAAALYLFKQVPPGKDPEAAKQMIAAALGTTYPLVDESAETASKTGMGDRPGRSEGIELR